MFKIIESKKGTGICCAYRCSRNKMPKNIFCSRHYWRRMKAVDVVRYTYHITKNNARVRGKEWKLTLEEFRKFCSESGYIEGKGKHKNSLTIDRKDNTKGYIYSNIRVITLEQNSIKADKPMDECPF